MGKPLKDLLEMEANLLYYLHLNNFDEREISEIDWFYGWLKEKKKKENGK
jgi:hypothetical protein